MSALQARLSDIDDAARRVPQNIDAEQALIGAVLLNNDAFRRVSSLVEAEHFHEPAHRKIWEVVAAQIGKGQVANPITLQTYLGNANFGGQTVTAYLARLASGATTVINAPDYARTVADTAMRRRLITLGETIVSMAQDAPVEATTASLLAAIEGEIEDLKPRITMDRADFRSFDDVAHSAIERMCSDWQNEGQPRGLSTGLPALDEVMGGLEAPDLIIVGGRTAMGKAQPLNAAIKTIDGWTTMGAVYMGQELASPDGRPSIVTGIFPQGVRPVFEITFSDGRKTKACAEHLWRVNSSRWESPRILSTADVQTLLSRVRYRSRLSVDLVSGDFGRDQHMPIDPWLLGLILGNGRLSGSVRLTTRDEENLARAERFLPAGMCIVRKNDGTHSLRQKEAWRRPGHKGVHPNPIAAYLREVGIASDGCHVMFVPDQYMGACRGNRMALLQGLLDSNGYVEKSGAVRFVTTSAQLAHDVEALVRSLGGLCRISTKRPTFSHKGEKKEGRLAFICSVRHANASVLFANSRKREAATRTVNTSVPLTIVKIEPAGQAETQCIRVSHPDSLYVTDDYVVTHNTALALNIASATAKELHLRRTKHQMQTGVVGFFSLEMGDTQLFDRMIAVETGIESWRIRRRKMTQTQLEKVVNTARDLRGLPLHIDETGSLTIAQVANKARSLKKRRGLELLVIDYLQLIKGRENRRDPNRAQEVTEISNGLKALAKELHVPIIALAQVGRQVDLREDRRPLLSDLRESGSIEQDADHVLFTYRDEYYEQSKKPKEGTDAFAAWERRMKEIDGVAEVIVAKNRHGRTGIVTLGYRADFTQFLNEPEPREIVPEEVRQRAAKKPTFTAEGTILYGLLKSLTLTRSTVASNEQRASDHRLCKGARLVPLEVARAAFRSEILPEEEPESDVVKRRFSAAFTSIRKAGIGQYHGNSDTGIHLWLPELVAE